MSATRSIDDEVRSLRARLLGCQRERRGATRRCEELEAEVASLRRVAWEAHVQTPVKSPCLLRETGPECSSAATTVAATAAVAAAATKAGCITDVGSDRMGCQGSGGAGGGGSKGRDASSCVGGGDGCEAGLRSRLAAAEARAARAEACAAGTEARLEEAAAQLRWLEKQLDDASGSGPSLPPHTTAIASCALRPPPL